jgi:hypothetical protein
MINTHIHTKFRPKKIAKDSRGKPRSRGWKFVKKDLKLKFLLKGWIQLAEYCDKQQEFLNTAMNLT